jgi:hypothetical protein
MSPYRQYLTALVRVLFAVLAGTAALAASSGAQAQMLTRMVSITTPTEPAPPAGTSENIVFSGQATLKTRRVFNIEDTSQSKLMVFLDFAGVTGRGVTSGSTYLVTEQLALVKPLGSAYTVELEFPFLRNMADPLTMTRTGRATLVFSVNVNTGAVTAATGTTVSRLP